MDKLPHWKVTDFNPAFYDTESMTAIEQTAKLYGAIQTMIEEFNTFIDNVNSTIEDFETGATSKYEDFAVGLRQEFQDFIDIIELRVTHAETGIFGELNNKIATIQEELDVKSEEFNEIRQGYNSILETVDTRVTNAETALTENFDTRFNNLQNEITTTTTEFVESTRQELEDFTTTTDARITNMENNMIDEIYSATVEEVNKAIASGAITLEGVYDEATESYNLILTGGAQNG